MRKGGVERVAALLAAAAITDRSPKAGHRQDRENVPLGARLQLNGKIRLKAPNAGAIIRTVSRIIFSRSRPSPQESPGRPRKMQWEMQR
jgi:hypothetical protein